MWAQWGENISAAWYEARTCARDRPSPGVHLNTVFVNRENTSHTAGFLRSESYVKSSRSELKGSTNSSGTANGLGNRLSAGPQNINRPTFGVLSLRCFPIRRDTRYH